MSEVTQILSAIDEGDARASAKLLPLVYEELRRLAAAKMAHEPVGGTLQATALVHEAYLKLVDGDASLRWDSRGHFFAAAAEAMRRILVDQARRRQSVKRGGNLKRADVLDSLIAAPEISEHLLTIDEALEKLSQSEPQAAELVKLKYFGGMTLRDAAKFLDIPPRTADQVWAYSRAWLFREIGSLTD